MTEPLNPEQLRSFTPLNVLSEQQWRELRPQLVPQHLLAGQLLCREGDQARLTYYLLGQYDPEFAALFRINADMESEIERSADNTAAYACLLATLARRAGLPPLSAPALARLIEHAARLAADAERLSARRRHA